MLKQMSLAAFLFTLLVYPLEFFHTDSYNENLFINYRTYLSLMLQ